MLQINNVAKPYLYFFIQSDKLHRQVSVEDGKKWAAENGCVYYETSAASKSGVKEMLDGLLKKIVERRMIKPKWIGDETK